MPDVAIWTLVISLAVLAFSMSLHAAHTAHALKLMEKEVERLIGELRALDQHHKKAITDLAHLHLTEKEKLFRSFDKALNKAISKSEKRSNRPRNVLAELALKK